MNFNRALNRAYVDAGLQPVPGLQKAGQVSGTVIGGIQVNDQWAQDYFETGYMSMPSQGGQKVMRVVFRSPNYRSPGSALNPLRPAGDVVYSYFHGPNVAGVTQFNKVRTTQGAPVSDPDLSQDSLNSFGNTETIPPFSFDGGSWPLGRILRGAIPAFQPDPTFTLMLESQRQQPVLEIDTSWLLVGHVDESVSFLRADSPRGWVMLVNDARLARQMLIDEQDAGFGTTQMFVGKFVQNDFGQIVSAAQSINQVLANTGVMNESLTAAALVDAQVEIIKAATGLSNAEIIRVPFLHEPVTGGPSEVFSLAYQPGTVNGLVLDRNHFAPPTPHGPVINGRDIMEKQLEDALRPLGYQVQWTEDWDLYHALSGEVHCGSNAFRQIPSALWWETGR